jgi:rhizosphere induced protein
MAENSLYELWFGNQSTNAGKACVYQNMSNVTANGQPKQLAWLVYGANQSTWIQFSWSLDYAFVWIDQGPPRSSQVESADLATSNSIRLSYNEFGYLFSGQTAGSLPGQLAIMEEISVPSVNSTVVGIGMSRAGTFGVAASPNNSLVFTPASELSYSITFGQYTFQAGDVLDTSTLNPSGLVRFPAGVNSMMAILTSANQWDIKPGQPPMSIMEDALVYEAGIGVVATGT